MERLTSLPEPEGASSGPTHRVKLRRTRRTRSSGTNRSLPSVPVSHQALCTAIAASALRPRTQGAVVGNAAGVWALESERREQNT